MAAPDDGAAPVGVSGTALQISTDSIPPRDRLALCREEFARRFLQVDIEPLPDEPFRVEATLRSLPGLSLLSCTVSASVWHRTSAIDGDDRFSIAVPLSGRMVLTQKDRSIVLQPGDAATITHSAAGRLVCPGGPGLGLVLPLSALEPLVGDPEAMCPGHIPHGSEPLRLLVHYLGVMRDDLTLASPELARLAVTHVHDLVALAIGATRDGTVIAAARGLRAARLRAIKADIAAHLHRADLSVTSVAKRQRVTPRYVHMLFEGEGTTFSRYVLTERLARARRMLADPRFDHMTVTGIAYACGFGDLSWFNRSFRSLYGETPSGVRTAGRPQDRAGPRNVKAG